MGSINYNSGLIRANVEKIFSEVCKNELNQFDSICRIVEKIINYLLDKSQKEKSLEYYTSRIIGRISDHMISATMLMGKGFIIDGINIVRSSYEDLWLVQNMFFKDNYFEEWINGQEVRPWRLRQLKEIEEIKEENEIIYKALCNISHCSVASVEHMELISTSIDALINDYRLVLISYYSFAIQITEALEDYYGKDEKLNEINEELMNLNIVFIEGE